MTMPTPNIGKYTPKTLTNTVYLHLRPKSNWRSELEGMSVVKMAKSVDALVDPGDYIVKLEVSVPATFFVDAMPSARIELSPGQVVPVTFTQTEEEEATA
jgi:hypothetical protein